MTCVKIRLIIFCLLNSSSLTLLKSNTLKPLLVFQELLFLLCVIISSVIQLRYHLPVSKLVPSFNIMHPGARCNICDCSSRQLSQTFSHGYTYDKKKHSLHPRPYYQSYYSVTPPRIPSHYPYVGKQRRSYMCDDSRNYINAPYHQGKDMFASYFTSLQHVLCSLQTK